MRNGKMKFLCVLMAYLEATVAVFLFRCRFVALLHPLFVLMHASLDFSACSCSCLSVFPTQNDVFFRHWCRY